MNDTKPTTEHSELIERLEVARKTLLRIPTGGTAQDGGIAILAEQAIASALTALRTSYRDGWLGAADELSRTALMSLLSQTNWRLPSASSAATPRRRPPMKREELIEHFRKLAEESAIAQRSHRRDGSHSEADYFFAQQETYAAAAEIIEESLPASSITLQLPTYAPGDPKAGEVVDAGQEIHWRNYASNPRSDVVKALAFCGENETMFALVGDGGHRFFMAVPAPYFSTHAARDAAMRQEDSNEQ